MKKKLNQKLLNEELKKFRLLSEYSFYTEKTKEDDDLILGSSLEEADEEPTDDSKTAANKTDDSENMFGSEDTGAEDAAAGDTGAEDASTEETGTEDTGTEDAGAEDTGAETPDAGAEEEVEVDVTQIVKGNEEAKEAATDASVKTSELLNKFSELEQRVAAMDSITSKIDTLEKEIVKRNPTPIEKLEMRSMSSFPYNIKLTDYWKDVEGYEASEENKPKEYILTKDDVQTSGVDTSIKKTFDVTDDYEEEDTYA
jgi:hypothetical protein